MEGGMNEAVQPLRELMCVGGWRSGRREAERSKGHPLERKAGRAGSSPFRPLKQKAAPPRKGLRSLSGEEQGPSTETWIPANLQS